MSTAVLPAARRTTGGGSLPTRLLALSVGLLLFGASVALLVRARLGLGSWDVWHQGIARRLGVPIGWVVIATGIGVLVLWWPLRVRPGLGTVSNVVVVGLAVDLTLRYLPEAHGIGMRLAYLAAGVLVNAVATALYVGAGLGPGPRDGLMLGLATRGVSVRAARTAIELTVLVAGWAAGGTVGIGTVVFALAIGPLVQALLPVLRTGPDEPAARRPTPEKETVRCTDWES